MSRSNTLIFLGVLTTLVPFSGIPAMWLEWLLPAIGLAVLVIGYGLRRRRPGPDSSDA